MLRRKKYQEKLLSQLAGQLENLERMVRLADNARRPPTHL
jgi:hypothetical protein